LQSCQHSLQTFGYIEPFTIGTKDFSSRLHLTKKLYGRDTALKVLDKAFVKASAGGVQAVLVRGYAGMGKSALIDSLRLQVVAKGGFFLSGKHDQYAKNQPYSALIAAIEAHVRQILSENESSVNHWRELLLTKLGNDAPALAALAPFIERLIGKQHSLEQQLSAEAQSRLYRAMVSFLRAFASKQRPVVLYLDDLQWSDIATLQWLERVSFDDSLQHLLLIGNYRDNEVDDKHPLHLLLERV
jgi:predicted ATPase